MKGREESGVPNRWEGRKCVQYMKNKEIQLI